MSNKGRKPNEKELSLWKMVKQTIKPLHDRVEDMDDLINETSMMTVKPIEFGMQSEQLQVPNKSPVMEYREKQLDRRTNDRLRKGKMPIEGVLDLHGMTQEQAHNALNGFIVNAFQWHKRCVLIITGKGSRSQGDGVLKTRLPEWISLKPLNEIVLKFVQAKPKDGGSGAFYLYLKRNKNP